MNSISAGGAVIVARKHFKVKVCLVGDAAVGKTAMIRRFVSGAFDDRYLVTLGTNVAKKSFHVVDPTKGLDADLDLMIWDVMGQPGFREMLRDAYFYEARGILAVADVTRRETLDGLGEWVRSVERTVGKVPVVVAVNKADLSADARFDETDAVRVAKGFGADVLMTSAKTGGNVEEAFRRLGSLVLSTILR